MRDDYAAGADLCEEHGLAESARVLRAVAEGVCEAFLIRPIDTNWDGFNETSGPAIEATSRTRPLFLDRRAAERRANHLKAEVLRHFRPSAFRWRFPLDLTEAEFCRRVSAILKTNYRLPRNLPALLFPEWASDEQLREIAPLVAVEFFEIVPVPIVPEEEP